MTTGKEVPYRSKNEGIGTRKKRRAKGGIQERDRLESLPQSPWKKRQTQVRNFVGPPNPELTSCVVRLASRRVHHEGVGYRHPAVLVTSYDRQGIA